MNCFQTGVTRCLAQPPRGSTTTKKAEPSERSFFAAGAPHAAQAPAALRIRAPVLIALAPPPPSRLAAYAPCALASVSSEIAPVRVRFRYVERGGFPACLPTGEARLPGNFLVFFYAKQRRRRAPLSAQPREPTRPRDPRPESSQG